MQEQKIHFSKPATGFFEAIPIGNGRLGGMVFGDPIREKLILNESTMWSGSVEDSDRMDAHEYLPPIRELLMLGKNHEAEELFRAHFTCRGEGTMFGSAANGPFGCYQVLGTLNMNFFNQVSYSKQSCGSVTGYTRDLDLDTATASVRFETCGETFTREYLSSAPDNAIVVRITAEPSAKVNFSVALDREENFSISVLPGNILRMCGQLHNGTDGKGVKYACHVGVKPTGGRLFENSGKLFVQGADEALVFVTAATNMPGFLGRNIKNEDIYSLNELKAVMDKGWNEILKDHISDYQRYYRRNTICFEKPTDYTSMDISDRIRSFDDKRDDYGLLELYYQFARYLLISSSRPDGMPCNLQGIWAEEIQTPWNGDWHLNAQQALYWLAETANLSELHMPFLKLTEKLVKPGEKTAKAYYGMRGWLAHTCTNPWGFTSPCEDASWGSTTGSAAWQCHHLFEHFLYTFDKEYLKRVYPVMKGAALFYSDMLVEEPKNHWLVTCPSSSPENSFYDSQNRKTSLCMGPSYDTQLVRSLFRYCIQAEAILQNDSGFSALLKEKLKKMVPVEIGSDGRIKEWLEEYCEVYPHHRHLSHLWGLYPGYLISREKTPELATAAEKSLISRGKTTAGWANAFRLCMWARLRDGKRAYSALVNAFKCSTERNMLNIAFHCDEMADKPDYPDIGNNYYPYQMDGNESSAAGISLMLIDTSISFDKGNGAHTDIYLLPALPKQLSGGSVTGMCAKGGFEADFSWHDGRLTKASIKNLCGNSADIYCNGSCYAVNTQIGSITVIYGK